jgi:hypothetical protein
MSTADEADGFYYDLVAKEDFEQLIGGVITLEHGEMKT